MTTRTGFFNAMAVQRRVIAAIIIREIHTRYGRDNLGFLWVMVEPLMFAGGVMALWLVIRGTYDHNIPIVPIVLFGYLPLLLFRHTVAHALNFAKPNVGLLYHRQVTLLDLIFARISLDFLGSTLAFVFAFGVLYGIGQLKWPVNITTYVAGLVLHGLVLRWSWTDRRRYQRTQRNHGEDLAADLLPDVANIGGLHVRGLGADKVSGDLPADAFGSRI